MTIADGPPTVPQVKAGKVKALAVTGAERSSELPDMPSMSEAGFPDVDIHLWSGIFAPMQRRPRSSPSCRRRWPRRSPIRAWRPSSRPWRSIPAAPRRNEFVKIIESDIVKYGDVIKAANLKFEE